MSELPPTPPASDTSSLSESGPSPPSPKCKQHIHYKCWVIDFTTCPLDELVDLVDWDGEDLWDLEGDDADPEDVVCFAYGGESAGRRLFLNARDGSIIEERIAWDARNPVDAKEYFDELKEAYRSLQLIPCPGRTPEEADLVAEAELGTHITQEQLLDLTRSWGEDLDIQYTRQLYRQYGWPDTLPKDTIARVIDELMERLHAKRSYEWFRNDLRPWWDEELRNLERN